MEQKINTLSRRISWNMDTNFLKIIAIITMTLDHVGKIIFPEIIILQIIGRVAFPVFAYCIVVGCLLTKDFKKYFLRLIIPAFIYQGVYILTGYFIPESLQYNVSVLNIFFTLALGALSVKLVEYKRWILLILLIILGYFINVDYGIYGILLMPLFYILRNNIKLAIILISVYLLWPYGIQKYAFVSIFPIFFKTNFNFKINKYFFYMYYPAHFLIIFLIKILL